MILSRAERLKAIEKFAVLIAQGVVGGKVTALNHPDGDLEHSGGLFSEVRSANVTSGAIIRKKQLRQHCRRGKTLNYVLVFHNNRWWDNGRYYYTTLKKCRTSKQAEDYLIENLTGVYIVGVGAMRILYRKLRRRRERTHYFKSGPKTYIKLRACDFFPYLRRAGFRSDQKHYSVRVGSRRVGVLVHRIFFSP